MDSQYLGLTNASHIIDPFWNNDLDGVDGDLFALESCGVRKMGC
jgi:hypothetical protein